VGLAVSVKIFLIDDHALFREGIELILHRLDTSLTVLHAASVELAVAVGRDTQDFDLILLDLVLPGMNGVVGLPRLRQRFPNSPVMIMSGQFDVAAREACLSGEAQGFIPKQVDSAYLLTAIRAVLAGGSWLTNHEDFLPRAYGDFIPRAYHEESLTLDIASLTPRQIDVLSYICQGHSNKIIARKLEMSENTVKTHMAVIFQVLGCNNRTEAALIARKKGYL